LALWLALLLGACQPTAEAPPAPPRLAFAETAYDFGRVAQGTPVDHHFPFVNAGGTDLTIINLRATCECEATLQGGRDHAPGGGGTVRGRFDTEALYGPQRWTITVYSNDPVQRTVTLSVSGEVVLDVAADPAQVYLGVVPPGVAALREVALRAGDDSIRVGAPQSDAAQLALRLDDTRDGSNLAATLTVGTAPDAQPGPFWTVVRLPTSSPQHPIVRVAVSGVIDPAAPTPRPLSVGPAPEAGAVDGEMPAAEAP
jgi:hypothetical protein